MFELTLICPCRNHVNANWPVYRDTPNSWDNCILFIVQACSKLGCPLDSGRHYTNKMEKDEVGLTFSTLHLFRLVFNQIRPSWTEDSFVQENHSSTTHASLSHFQTEHASVEEWRFSQTMTGRKTQLQATPSLKPKLIWKNTVEIQTKSQPKARTRKIPFSFFFGLQQTLHLT